MFNAFLIARIGALLGGLGDQIAPALFLTIETQTVSKFFELAFVTFDALLKKVFLLMF